MDGYSKTIPQKELDDDYNENVQTEYDIRTVADIEKARLEGLADRSAFENLAMQSKARYVKDCLDFEQLPCFPENTKNSKNGELL